MARALDEMVVEGVATNQAFHRRLMADAEFRAGDIDIQFLERRPDLALPEGCTGARGRARGCGGARRGRCARPAPAVGVRRRNRRVAMARTGAARGTAVTPVRILRLAAGGDGVGKLDDGRTVFVPRTAPGDLVELAEIRLHRRYARARAGRVLEPSAHRVEPRCPHYVEDECGGCQLQHLEPTAQREARRGFVGDALRRIAGLDLPDPEMVPPDAEFEYRTKITLAVEPGGDRIGLHPLERPDQVFDLVRCHITRAGADGAVGRAA